MRDGAVRAGWKGGGFKPGRRGRRMRVAGWVAADAAALFVSNAGGWGRRRAGPARQPRLRWRRRSSSTVLRARCPLLLGVARAAATAEVAASLVVDRAPRPLPPPPRRGARPTHEQCSYLGVSAVAFWLGIRNMRRGRSSQWPPFRWVTSEARGSLPTSEPATFTKKTSQRLYDV
jgi:hypothetical protein